jgi:hypothetical protein
MLTPCIFFSFLKYIMKHKLKRLILKLFEFKTKHKPSLRFDFLMILMLLNGRYCPANLSD